MDLNLQALTGSLMALASQKSLKQFHNVPETIGYSQKDEGCRDTDFGARWNGVQREAWCFKKTSGKGSCDSSFTPEWVTETSQCTISFPFDLFVILPCSHPSFFSVYGYLLNLGSTLLFHFSPHSLAKTECFPYCAFGLSWQLNTCSFVKSTQNQCILFQSSARLQMYL